MAVALVGEEFVRCRLDEAISIQDAIVAAGSVLATDHPVPEVRVAVAASVKDDRPFLAELRRLGTRHAATGGLPDAGRATIVSLGALVAATGGSESAAFDALSALLGARRAQQDLVGSILAIGQMLKDRELSDTSREFLKVQRESSQALADMLARFAVRIASQTNDSHV